MADYTPEQVEKLATFVCEWIARSRRGFPAVQVGEDLGALARKLGLMVIDNGYAPAPWLRPEDWADRAARDYYGTPDPKSVYLPQVDPEELRRLAAIIRRHAEDRT